MDQENTKGQDKRNWRERLGIGAQGNKDLPKISDDFKKEAPAVAAQPVGAARPAPRPAASGVKPAPMAPRANPKPPAGSPVPSDRLAERLRSQREASTRLAEQRVQVAKQRAETQFVPVTPAAAPKVTIAAPAASSAPKPKFTFAEEGNQSKAAAAEAARPATTPAPAVAPTIKPQITPARMPLGGTPPAAQPSAFQARPASPGFGAPPPAYTPQQPPAGYQPTFNPQSVPPYRPIDPATGLPQQSGYIPPRSFSVPPPQGGFTGGPRLNVPPRVPATPAGGYAPTQGYDPRNRLPPADGRLAPPAGPQGSEFENEFYEEMPQPRVQRPTSTDYQQAYREAEYGYEDEPQRSRTPWILAGLLLFALLLAAGLVWAYLTYAKPLMTGQAGTQEVPAVTAPETPAKVQAEQPAAAAQQPAPAIASPTKKQIYDRIVGDQEILGGEVAPPAESPAAIPEPAQGTETAPQPSGGTGDDAAPLPIPPPPGGTGDQQGSLEPASEKQSSEIITPAAGESQAAVVAQEQPPAAVTALEKPPAPGELPSDEEKTRGLADIAKPTIVPEVAAPESEAIKDEEPVVPVKKKAVAAKKQAEKAAVATKLGTKPVVLVPPAKKVKAAPSKPVANTKVANGSDVAADGGLFGTEDITVKAGQPAAPVTPAPKKKRTLADLFSSNDDEPDLPAEKPAQVAAAKPAVSAKKQTAAPTAPPPAAVASADGSFVVQLASFRSRDEASTEFSRLKSKHGAVLSRFSPIVSEATVGGSTRFRLSVGRMESQAQANAVCSSLFARGERDCLVKKQ